MLHRKPLLAMVITSLLLQSCNDDPPQQPAQAPVAVPADTTLPKSNSYLAGAKRLDNGNYELTPMQWEFILDLPPYQKHDLTYGGLVGLFYQWLVNDCVDFTSDDVHGCHLDRANLLAAATNASGADAGVQIVICADQDRYPDDLYIVYAPVPSRDSMPQGNDMVYIDTASFKTVYTSGSSYNTILKNLYDHPLNGRSQHNTTVSYGDVYADVLHFNNHEGCAPFGYGSVRPINASHTSFFNRQELIDFINSEASDGICLFYGFDESGYHNKVRVVLAHESNYGADRSKIDWKPNHNLYMLEHTYP